MTTTLSKEIAAYERIRNALETDHFGKWVLVHDEKLVDIYSSFEETAQDAVERFGRGPYLIKRVGEPPMTLPASVFVSCAHRTGVHQRTPLVRSPPAFYLSNSRRRSA